MLPESTDNGTSFFLDAMYVHVTSSDTCDLSTESRDEPRDDAFTMQTDSNPNIEYSNAIAESGQAPDLIPGDNTPQAMLVFVIGEHRFSDTYELGVLNEHPNALKTITSNQSLSTSAFLTPALHAVMAELRPSMMVQVAVRLTTIALRLIGETLPNHVLAQRANTGDEQQKLSDTVRSELERAVPYYQWQGPRNYHGRVQYLMALLEEAIRVLALSKVAFMDALKLDAPAARAAESVVQSILHLEQNPEDVCGKWAADTLLSALVPRKARQRLGWQTSDPLKEKEDGTKRQYSEDEEELPSASELVRRAAKQKIRSTISRAERRVQKPAEDDSIKFGSADDPLYISDSDPSGDLHQKPKAARADPKGSRHSSRGEAHKEVNYDMKRHPQDQDLPRVRKRRRMTQAGAESAEHNL